MTGKLLLHVVLFACFAFVSAQAEARKPNILLVITDDQGWGDVTSHGNAQIHTPHMDALAASGARFDKFYVSPVCAPTRASLLTGRYNWRTGVSGVSRGMESLRENEITLAEVLQQAGYATGAFGKWHNGAHFPYHPNGQGFAEFLGFCRGHWNNYFDTTLERNGVEFKSEGYINDVVTDAALDFMRAKSADPFFCYVAYNTPHTPMQVPDAYFDAAKARGLDDSLAAVYAMCESIDHNLGRMLAWLDESALADDTIVVFMGDNGPNTDRYNGGMRGRKSSLHEGGTRNILFVRYPDKIPAGTVVSSLAAHIDLLPTLSELAGVKHPEAAQLDGISLVPQMQGGEPGAERMLFELWGGHRAIRTPQYRWVREGKEAQLYDMIADPGQASDIAADHPEIAARFDEVFAEQVLSAVDVWTKPPPIPVGHDAAPVVRLDGPESILSGGPKLYGKHPNNSWITEWTSTEGAARWDLDVVRDGTYEVTVRYVCAEENLGARMQVAAGGASAEAEVTQAHDPAYLPSPDRVPRTEVHEKEWAELIIGPLNIEKGSATLELRATSIPGASAPDIKVVVLRWIDPAESRQGNAPA